jgi:DMSO/TMAO reductase YedYZ molybdopterin-dependent catalytic subunit
MSYNSTYADLGYTVTVKASDNFSKDFPSATLKMNNDIILAYKMDGKALPDDSAPLKLVGKTLTKGQMVKSIVEIDLK